MTDFDPRTAIDARLDQISATINERLKQPGEPLTNLELAAMRLYPLARWVTSRHSPLELSDGRTICTCAPADADFASMHNYPCPVLQDIAVAFGMTPRRKSTNA